MKKLWSLPQFCKTLTHICSVTNTSEACFGIPQSTHFYTHMPIFTHAQSTCTENEFKFWFMRVWQCSIWCVIVYLTMPFPFIKWKTKLHKIVSQKFWWVKLWLFCSAIIQCNPPALIEWKSWLRGMGNVLKLSGSPLSNPLSEAAS